MSPADILQPIVLKRFIDTRRGQLLARGCGDDPSIVMLQTLPFGSAMLEPIMRALAVRGVASLAFDLMGYGGSDPRHGDWRVEDYAENLFEAIVATEARPRVILGGHFSAMVAVEMALRDRALAPRVALDGIPVWDEAKRRARMAANRGSSPLSTDGAALLDRWRRTLAVIERADPTARLTQATENMYLEAFRAFLALDRKPGPEPAFFAYPTSEKLPLLACPVLMIGSSTDTLRDDHPLAMAAIAHVRELFFAEGNPLYALTRPAPAAAIARYCDALMALAEAPTDLSM